MRRIALLVLVGALGATAGAPAHAATLRCGLIAFTPNSDDGAFDIRATGTSCKRAREIARATRNRGVTSRPRTFRKLGYTCRGRYDGSTLPTVYWRCTKSRAVVTFQRS